MKNKEAGFSVVILLLIGLLLPSCKIDTTTITGITPTPITPSPTPRECPPNTSLDGMDDLTLHPKLIVILFDLNSTAGQKVLEYSDGKKTADIWEFLDHFLPKVLGPGDQVSFFSLGFRDYNAARRDRYVSGISESPRLVPTPHYPETLTPIPTPTLSGVVLQDEQGRREYHASVTAQYATATQRVFEYQCDVDTYRNIYQATATQWSVTKAVEATAISTQIRGLRTATPKAIETPFAQNNVYEGLAHVTVDFENLCSLYDRCILLIFDDLIDWRNVPVNIDMPSYLQINLNKVEVLAIMPQCDDIFEPACTKIQDLWTDELKSVGATSVDYYNGDRLEQTLINRLGGQK